MRRRANLLLLPCAASFGEHASLPFGKSLTYQSDATLKLNSSSGVACDWMALSTAAVIAADSASDIGAPILFKFSHSWHGGVALDQSPLGMPV